MTEPTPTTYDSVKKSSTIIPIVKIPGVWIMSSGQFGGLIRDQGARKEHGARERTGLHLE